MTITLYAKRLAIVNGDTTECHKLLDEVMKKGNTYLYVGVRVNNEVYANEDVHKICHILSSQDLVHAQQLPSKINYFSGFGMKSDPVLGYVVVTLASSTTGSSILGSVVMGQSLTQKCRPVYNKNSTSGQSICKMMTSRNIAVIMQERTKWFSMRKDTRANVLSFKYFRR